MKARVLCCGCGKFLHWGDTSDGKPSHSLCPECEEVENRKVDEYFRREALHQQEEPAEVSLLGLQEPPDDSMIYNRRQPDGTFRPLAGFWERKSAPPSDEKAE